MPTIEKLNLDNLRPHTIWKQKVNGKWEYVYLESLTSKLIRNGISEVDFRTSFGLEHLPRGKFLKNFIYVGDAILKITELASLKNIKLNINFILSSENK